jgi:hypothetical protein
MTNKANILRTIGTVLFVGIVFFTVVFGTYQIFFDKAEAALFHCNENVNCTMHGPDCSGSIKCHCSGDIFFVCMIGEFRPLE